MFRTGSPHTARGAATTAIVLALALAAPSPSPAEATPEKTIFPYETRVETLDNGLSVILVPMAADGLVAYWSIVRTGSRDEFEPNRSGFAHFFEHMMFRGTEKVSAEEYGAAMKAMGADYNAFTTDDFTAYHLGVAAEDLERVMDLESDRFMHLAYDEGVFKTEAGAVYGEYRKNRSSWFLPMYEAVSAEAFRSHTYGHTTMGYEADIKIMPELFEYSRSFFDRYYRPDNTVLLVVGDIDPDATLALAKRHYGDWEAGHVEPKIPTEPEQTSARRTSVAYAGRTLPMLWVGYKFDAFDPASTDVVAGTLLADLLFGETSELYRDLVLDEQVVEFLAASSPVTRDPKLFDIIARIKDPSKVDYVEGRIEQALAAARDGAPDPKRLEDVKSRTKYAFLMGLDTPDAVASSLARMIAVTGGIDAIETMYGTLERITGDDVQKAAQRYFRDSGKTVATLRGAS